MKKIVIGIIMLIIIIGIVIFVKSKKKHAVDIDGAFVITVIDALDNPVPNINYNFFGNDGKVWTTLTTNESGSAGIKNLPDGEYCVQEIDKENAKKYCDKIVNSKNVILEIDYVE